MKQTGLSIEMEKMIAMGILKCDRCTSDIIAASIKHVNTEKNTVQYKCKKCKNKNEKKIGRCNRCNEMTPEELLKNNVCFFCDAKPSEAT